MILDFKKEAAKYLNITVSALNDLIKIGDIKVYGSGINRYIDFAELSEYMVLKNSNYQKCLKNKVIKNENIIISNVPKDCIKYMDNQKKITGKCRSRQIVAMIKKEMSNKLNQ